ncbi:MAG: hypothetical protein KDC87_05310 [Planctomycetes bacterium]|nr:hypothetical protein [Planctomycetota bacterium]
MIRPTARTIGLLAAGLPIAAVPTIAGAPGAWTFWLAWLGGFGVALVVELLRLPSAASVHVDVTPPPLVHVDEEAGIVVNVASSRRVAVEVRLAWVGDVEPLRAAVGEVVPPGDSIATLPLRPRRRGTVRRIDQARIIRRPHGMDLVVQGNGFLYNMVRAIAGTLQRVGTGRMPPERVREILLSRDRRQAGSTAPASGLFLLRVLYPPAAWIADALYEGDADRSGRAPSSPDLGPGPSESH